MKEFLKKVLNALFPNLATRTAGWLCLFIVIFLVTAVILTIVLLKNVKKKNEVNDITIEESSTENAQEQEEIKNVEQQEESTKIENVEENTKEEQSEEVVKAEEPKETNLTPKTEKKSTAKKSTKKSTTKTENADVENNKKEEKNKTAKKTVKKETPKVEESNEQSEEVKTKNQKYMVIYDKEKKDWVIKKTGAAKASKRCKTKKEALEFVEKYAENQDLNVSVKKKDGKFQKKY